MIEPRQNIFVTFDASNSLTLDDPVHVSARVEIYVHPDFLPDRGALSAYQRMADKVEQAIQCFKQEVGATEQTEEPGVTVVSSSGVKEFIPCVPGKTHDGHHDINELYAHRNLLFALLLKTQAKTAWRSRREHDGSQLDGWFVAGMDLPGWDVIPITYHLPNDLWELLDNLRELDCASASDGHTSRDVLERLKTCVGGIKILYTPDKPLSNEEIARQCADDGCDWDGFINNARGDRHS